MGIWSSTREVDRISRMVTASGRDHAKLRAELTLHFDPLETQADAQTAADRCAARVSDLLKEADDHRHLLGRESEIAARVKSTLPKDLGRVRRLELEGLQVAGTFAGANVTKPAAGTTDTDRRALVGRIGAAAFDAVENEARRPVAALAVAALARVGMAESAAIEILDPISSGLSIGHVRRFHQPQEIGGELASRLERILAPDAPLGAALTVAVAHIGTDIDAAVDGIAATPA